LEKPAFLKLGHVLRGLFCILKLEKTFQGCLYDRYLEGGVWRRRRRLHLGFEVPCRVPVSYGWYVSHIDYALE
jgi:hypothetical protein